ncbi:PucR family transcriptional regulator [Neobacillus dielmonensis]|uniref:PucR family transcriptional regulator n=1 Tax=Neobacillus dielmonensis TaxID=1347369 RepID=UPI0005A5EC49|nr:PucR family transcriptional regulator [Neobacillus dielmonensis]
MDNSLHDPFRTTFDSLDEFADLISQVLKCPITIEDANHRLLAYSTHDERTDPARIATIIGRRVPEKVINQLWKEGTIPALLKTREPIRVQTMNEIGLGNRVAISIWKNEEVLGFIWALEIDKSLSDKELYQLKKAADAVKNKLLQLQTRKNKKEERSQELFWKLLTGHLTSHDEILDHFRSLKITPSTSFVILVFQFQENINRKEEQYIMYLLKTIQRLKIILYTIDCDQLILLTSADQIKNLTEELDHFSQIFVGKMNERYKITGITPVYSGIYQDYQKIGKAYNETLTVLSIKSKFPAETKKMFSFQQLGIYQFFDLLLKSRQNNDYVNESLRKLHDYDHQHNSNLIKTLEVYLDHDSNLNDTAKQLNIHTNTLNYRLKRITEIAQVNLKEPNQKMMLYIDLKLEKYHV